MAYEATEWACGDTVTADKLNKLERGVQGIMSDYVPTEWQCGDTITADKLNKLEQAVANAEGGSSDFSTAEVTFICNSENEVQCWLALAQEAAPPFEPNPCTQAFITIASDDEFTVTAVLYKGTNHCVFVGATQVSGTGDVTIDGFDADITGDCTITIS